jgi:hypothetical protein
MSYTPRQSRLDTLGALHHIIARGNERRKIFEDKKDCKEFLIRLGDILSGTETICYAWVCCDSFSLTHEEHFPCDLF